MSNDNDEKKDLTRIENLGDFVHDEDEDFSDLETYSSDSKETEEGFSNQATDPNLILPPEFRPSSNNDRDEHGEKEAENSLENEDENFDTSVFSQYEEDAQDPGPDAFNSESNFDQEDDNAFESFSLNEDADDQFNTFEENNDAFAEENNDFSLDSEFESDDDSGEDLVFDSNVNSHNDENNESDDHGDPELDQPTNHPELTASTEHIEQDLSFSYKDSKVETIQQEQDSEVPASSKTQLESYSPVEDQAEAQAKPASADQTISQLQKFAKNITYGDLTAEGNPPYSIIIKNIRYREDIDDIIALLNELKIIDNSTQESTLAALERGSMLIPRISEYAAIIICHKLRRFHLDLLMGLSEEIHGPKETHTPAISKSSVYGDYSHSFELSKSHIKPNDVMTTTTNTLEGHEIVQYLGVVSERTVVDMEHFSHDNTLEIEILNQLPGSEKNEIMMANIRRQNKTAAKSKTLEDLPGSLDTVATEEKPIVSLSEIYQDLAFKLKAHAITFKGNAVVGINYQVTPILLSENLGVQSKYQITCTGSVVWAVKK